MSQHKCMQDITLSSQQDSSALPVNSERDVEEAIRDARRKAYLAGFEKPRIFMICTITAELCRNILYHAGGGEFMIRNIHSETRSGIELEAIDHGPGIGDIDLAMQDNFSTRGTLGIGLPAIKRLSDEIDIQSSPEQGTIIKARKWL